MRSFEFLTFLLSLLRVKLTAFFLKKLKIKEDEKKMKRSEEKKRLYLSIMRNSTFDDFMRLCKDFELENIYISNLLLMSIQTRVKEFIREIS